MSEIIWKDATSYSQGERGKVEPRAWECAISGIRVWVGKLHGLPQAWVVKCHRFGLHDKTVAAGTASPDEARSAAIFAVRHAAFDMITDMQNFIAATEPAQ